MRKIVKFRSLLSMKNKANIHVIGTGGTIANSTQRDTYLTTEELIDEIPKTKDIAQITTKDVASLGSSEITAEEWFALHNEITKLERTSRGFDGYVITHGSNTIEETAYFLNLTLKTEKPVVLTAAQRERDRISNDGDRNLVDAIRVARSTEAHNRGALVVVNENIHHSRHVTKSVSNRPDAWVSSNLGPVGMIDKNANVQFYHSLERLHTVDTEFDLDQKASDDFPNVEIVYSAAGMSGEILTAASHVADGIVIAGLPTGTPAAPHNYNDNQLAIAEETSTSVPVVLSHRGQEGWPYPQEPFIWGDILTPQKARILLGLGLTETNSKDELQQMFKQY